MISLCLPLQAWSASHDLSSGMQTASLEHSHERDEEGDEHGSSFTHHHSVSHQNADHDHSKAALAGRAETIISILKSTIKMNLAGIAAFWRIYGLDKPPRFVTLS
ncbi:MAG: hypothetical protein MI743_04855 [Sneathiellales bacterium]|nr:hypothetical protein [Sneathiellales bacterium]